MNMRLRGSEAFTLVEIMIVVAIIGLLVAIAIPNFVRARTSARTNLCQNNMRLLGHAAEQWIIDNNENDFDTNGTIAALEDYIKGGAPECPQNPIDNDTDYTVADSGVTDGVLVSCTINAVDHGTYDTGTPSAGI